MKICFVFASMFFGGAVACVCCIPAGVAEDAPHVFAAFICAMIAAICFASAAIAKHDL